MALFVSMLCVCFLSVPAFADGGDEDPWDADDGSGGTNGGDLGGGDDGSAMSGFLKEADIVSQPGGGIFSDLFMSITLEMYDYFYGSSLGSASATSKDVKERSTSVNWRSYSDSSVR